jgi:hypothetical protein
VEEEVGASTPAIQEFDHAGCRFRIPVCAGLLASRNEYGSLAQRIENAPIWITAIWRVSCRNYLRTTEFPAEFANFVSYVGPNDVQRAVDKVIRKLALFGAAPRNLFGTRYFFHEEIARFTDDPNRPFQLDIRSASSIRAAGFVAATNRARFAMTKTESSHFREMILDNMKLDRDFRQIEHEMRCYVHFRQKGHGVIFSDLGHMGGCDLLCTSGKCSFEVEAKTISPDTGNPIKSETLANFAQLFSTLVADHRGELAPGIFTIKFGSELKASNALSAGLKGIISDTSLEPADRDTTITFVSRPAWNAIDRLDRRAIQEMIKEDKDVTAHHCFTRSNTNLVGLTFVHNKSNTLVERVTRVIKNAADQLSGSRASVIWLHFVDLPESDFLALAQFAMSNKGRGLDALVANALIGRGTKDRNHVSAVMFSAEAEGITHRPALDQQLVLSKAASISGPVYLIQNASARFKLSDNMI